MKSKYLPYIENQNVNVYKSVIKFTMPYTCGTGTVRAKTMQMIENAEITTLKVTTEISLA